MSHNAERGDQPDVYAHVRERLRRLRTRHTLSQVELGRSLGVPPNTVSRWETGRYRPDLDDVQRMARFFNVPISEFFPAEDTPGDDRLSDLLGTLRGLPERDLDELRRYAEFRRAQLEARLRTDLRDDPGTPHGG